jgi:hypothetical protein
VLCQPRPTLLGEPFEWARKDDAGASDGIALTQHEVGGEVSGGPSVEQRGCVRSEFVEEIAPAKALLGVKWKIVHVPMVPKVIRLVRAFAVLDQSDTDSEPAFDDRAPGGDRRTRRGEHPAHAVSDTKKPDIR